MDIRYKSYAARASQDRRFDQLLRAPISQSSSVSRPLSLNIPPSITTSSSDSKLSLLAKQNSNSPRKRVTVVSFTSQDIQEVVHSSPSPTRSTYPPPSLSPPIIETPISMPRTNSTQKHLAINSGTVTQISPSVSPSALHSTLRAPLLSQSNKASLVDRMPVEYGHSKYGVPTKRKNDFDSALMEPKIPVTLATISRTTVATLNTSSVVDAKKSRITTSSSALHSEGMSDFKKSVVISTSNSISPPQVSKTGTIVEQHSVNNGKQITTGLINVKISDQQKTSLHCNGIASNLPSKSVTHTTKLTFSRIPSSPIAHNKVTDTANRNQVSSSSLTFAKKDVTLPSSISEVSLSNHSTYSKVLGKSNDIISNKPAILSKSSSMPATTSQSHFKQFESKRSSAVESSDTSSNSLRKSKSLFSNRTKKAAYNPRQWQQDIEEEESNLNKTTAPISSKPTATKKFDFDDDDDEQSKPTQFSTSKNQKDNNFVVPSSQPMRHKPKNHHSDDCTGRPVTSNIFDDFDATDDIPGSKLRVSKNQKALYSVVHNVKEAHECQESGETQDLLDDVEYIIQGLKDSHQPITRSLSVLTLANKCLTRSFRELLNAYGLFSKTFSHLHDADVDQTLTLCVAGLFYIMSRDRQPAHLDKNALRLMLKLLNANGTSIIPPTGASNRLSKEEERVRYRLKETLEKLHKGSTDESGKSSDNNPNQSQSLHDQTKKAHNQFGCRHLQLNNQLTARDLLMESLLNLSTRKASDWFKNEVREHQGLARIGDATISAVEYFGGDLNAQTLDDFTMNRLERIYHYLRLMENMTFLNCDNQSHIVQYRDRCLLDHLLSCLRLCMNNIPHQKPNSPEKRAVVSCMLAILRLFLNVSHDNEMACDRLGACPSLLQLCLESVLYLPETVPPSKRLDLMLLSLGLMINLAEKCIENRSRLMYMDLTERNYKDQNDEYMNSTDNRKINAMEALTKLYVNREESAGQHDFERDDEDGGNDIGDSCDPADESTSKREELKWRLIEDKKAEKKNKQKRNKRHTHGYDVDDDSESDSDSDADSGADVEFVANTEEEEEKLKEKLDSAGQHMEDSMVAAYTALLIGTIIQDNRRYAERVRRFLPEGKFRTMAIMLAKLLSFFSLTSAIGQGGDSSILNIIRVLEAQDK